MIQNITISKPFHYQNIDENYSLVRKPTISINQFYVGLNEISGRNVNLSSKQRSIIEKGEGPLWIIAGPGSGKTEVLVRRCLKLLLGDDIDPRSIIITTFTEKAASNLKDRSINYKAFLAIKYPQVNTCVLITNIVRGEMNARQTFYNNK